MGSPRERLALRVIVVGTRAAVKSHRSSGTERMVPATARRGIELLDRLEARVGSDVAPDFRDAMAEARRELTGLAHGTESTQWPSANEAISRPE